MNKGLPAPFPYFGGKGRWAAKVWQRFGHPHILAEPFAGSLAVLLHRPTPCKREVVCDTDGHVCNFWRAMAADAAAVAREADYPTIHQDLTARHRWLREWARQNAERLSHDPFFHDVRAAGWWAWGKSLWIGAGWCAYDQDQIPMLTAGAFGQGVQRRHPDTIPALTGTNPNGGRGVAVERKRLPDSGTDGDRGSVGDGSRLLPWFLALQRRLSRVTVLNRPWTSALTRSVLSDTDSAGAYVRAVFLDPPYSPESRKSGLYAEDDPEGHCSRESFRWALEHADLPGYRIAYCCPVDEFPTPEGWIELTARYKGKGREAGADDPREKIIFSPGCIDPAPSLFGQ